MVVVFGKAVQVLKLFRAKLGSLCHIAGAHGKLVAMGHEQSRSHQADRENRNRYQHFKQCESVRLLPFAYGLEIETSPTPDTVMVLDLTEFLICSVGAAAGVQGDVVGTVP